MKPSNRLRSVTTEITIGGGHTLAVSLAYDNETDLLREVVFVGRGKIGQGLDMMLHDLGIKLSRAIQGRDPETGEVLDNPAKITHK